MYEWNDDWRNTIPTDMLTRLAECRNKPMDVVEMATEMHKYNPTMTAEDCFLRMFEWVTDWNGQLGVLEKIDSDWDWYLSGVK